MAVEGRGAFQAVCQAHADLRDVKGGVQELEARMAEWLHGVAGAQNLMASRVHHMTVLLHQPQSVALPAGEMGGPGIGQARQVGREQKSTIGARHHWRE